MSFPPAYPHDPIHQVIPDVFIVRGSIPLNPLMRISRNMAIVRHEGELTLVDPIRLTPAGEAQLRQLGTVKRILRLGPLHGVDDPYYTSEFDAELWAPGVSEAYPDIKPDVQVAAATALPFPDARLVFLEGANQPEATLLIQRAGGLLITCDAIQHYGDYTRNSLLARLAMPFIGFPRTTLIGPIWLKLMTPEGASLEGAFRRILEHDFDKLLSAHGTVLASGAKAAVAGAIDKAFSS